MEIQLWCAQFKQAYHLAVCTVPSAAHQSLVLYTRDDTALVATSGQVTASQLVQQQSQDVHSGTDASARQLVGWVVLLSALGLSQDIAPFQ